MIKILLAFAIIFITSSKCWAYAEFQQTIVTTVPAATEITAINIPLSKGTINPETGNNSGLYADFELKTNGVDADYDYVITATLLTTGGVSVNAYSQNGGLPYILLGNNSASLYPTSAAVNNIQGGAPAAPQNPNVIAYPVSTSVSGLNSATFTTVPAYGGLCFIVTTGSSQQGTASQAISTVPLANTYSYADSSGTYESIVTFSAYRKP